MSVLPCGRVSRRRWFELMTGSATSLFVWGCSTPTSPSPQQQQPQTPPPPASGGGNPRLTARPHVTATALAPGVHPLGLGGSARDGLLYIPPDYDVVTGIPLIVVLHGLGGHVGELARSDVMPMVPETADAFRVAFLFPESRAVAPSGWDRSNGNFGPDIAFIDAALAQTFDRLNVTPSRIAVWGFSDGASYSLSMGLCNGDLFSHVAAFSPEYMSAPQPIGQPRVFVSHGRSDPFVPVVRSRTAIVPDLRNGGYAVDYVEFDGGHHVDPAARTQAMTAFLG
jgi:phospholipase/carboxylesterase